jgi:hypothetical protein
VAERWSRVDGTDTGAKGKEKQQQKIFVERSQAIRGSGQNEQETSGEHMGQANDDHSADGITTPAS